MAKRGPAKKTPAPHGQGSITLRKDGRYMGQIRVGTSATGKSLRRTVYGDTRKAVASKLLAVTQDVKLGRGAPASRDRLADYLAWWLEHVSLVRPTTKQSYRLTIQTYINPYIGGVRLSELEPSHARILLSALRNKRLSDRTIQYAYTILRKALNDAKVDRYIPYNPLSDVKPPKVTIERREPITLADVQTKLHALSDHRLYAMFHLGFMGGMRRAELCALRWVCVDLEQGMIQVTQSMSRLDNSEIYIGAPKTNSGVRQLPIDQDTAAVLRQHKRAQNVERLKAGDLYQDNGLVFCRADGSYLVPAYVGHSYTYHIKKYLGIHDTLHGMRHAHGSILHEAGEDLKAIQDRLGHASVATTQHYIHASVEKQRGAVDAIARKLRPRTRTKAQ